MTDRVVQAALKLVLEPIFEADFMPASDGFRPRRRARDAIAEIRQFGSKATGGCWMPISGHASTPSATRRWWTGSGAGSKTSALALVKAFLKAGIRTGPGGHQDTHAGTPQGSLCAAAHNPPYEQRWVMRSAGGSALVGAVVTTGRCA